MKLTACFVSILVATSIFALPERHYQDIFAAQVGGRTEVAAGDGKLRDDLASIQRIVTPQGLVKFIAARTRDGHADRATALALALHAAEKQPEGFGLSQINPARVGENRRRVRPQRTRFRKAWSTFV